MTDTSPSGIPSHETARRYFVRAIERGRLSHAYLLLGPEGSGKRRFARELVKALFCAGGTGCGECPACRAIDHGNHPAVDFHGPAEGKSMIDIDTIRELCARACLKRDGLQVAVLEQAELLSEPAANALLKTLEEPPGRLVIILTAQSVGTLLPTLVSRCHRILFTGPPEGREAPPPEVLEHMARVRRAGFHAEEDVRAWLAGLPGIESGATVRQQVRHLLDRMIEASRARLGVADPGDEERSASRLERLLGLRQDLDRNVHPDLVLEAAIAD